MSQNQSIVREAIAKSDKNFVDDVLAEAATQEASGNLKDAESLLQEALIIEDFHRTRIALAA